MWIAASLLIAFTVREIYLAWWLQRSVPIRTRRAGWLVSVELRRRVGMERLPSHVSEFPVPREERILVSRLCGIVLWHAEMSVALPQTACDHLDAIAPQEFDRQFPAWLRLAAGAAG